MNTNDKKGNDKSKKDDSGKKKKLGLGMVDFVFFSGVWIGVFIFYRYFF